MSKKVAQLKNRNNNKWRLLIGNPKFNNGENEEKLSIKSRPLTDKIVESTEKKNSLNKFLTY
jgi:hypothetical protein